jgi:GDP/UDP-N,N'-diacetylbacillosamine 2-epimerase (hydrolysing)
MEKIISILTASRAEYGLLKPIIAKLKGVPEFDVRIAITGMHLSEAYGMTYKEIEQDGNLIDVKIGILQETDTPSAVSIAMSKAILGFAEYFKCLKPDLLLVLGDRYETLSVCIAAMNARIPIAHLYGGETTEGALDEAIRHAITKMSYLHFTSTELYRKHVIQLGEEPSRVYQVGAVGIENIRSMKLLHRKELSQSLGITLDRPYALVTFHPATLEKSGVEAQMEELFGAFEQQKDLNYIFTKSNADSGGLTINRMIDHFVREHKNACAFESLGVLRYLSAVKYCEAVIGNSSSGLIEAPSFGVPTINIGDRQRGRIQSTSVINCDPTREEINRAITLARTREYKEAASKTVNPYGDGSTSDKVVEVLKEYILGEKFQLMKRFYEIDFSLPKN